MSKGNDLVEELGGHMTRTRAKEIKASTKEELSIASA